MKNTFRGMMAGAAAILLLAAGAARGQVTSYWQTTSGTFQTGANWDKGSPGLTTNFVFSVPNTTYTVTYTGSRTTYSGIITNVNQNVTFDMGGFTHTLNQPVGYAGQEFLIGNVNDNVKLTVSNGTFLVSEGTNYGLNENAGNTLVVTNGGKVRTSMFNYSGNVLVSGTGSYMNASEGGNANLGAASGGTLTINDGAAVRFRNGANSSLLLLIDGGTLTNAGHIFLNYGGSLLRVMNGGKMYAEEGGGATLLSQQSGNTSRLIIGSDSGTSIVSQLGINTEESTSVNRGQTETIVSTNGVLQIRGGVPTAIYNVSNFYGNANVRLQNGVFLTLESGSVAMNTGTVLAIMNNVPFNGYNSGQPAATLRGYGTFSNYTATGPNFTIYNDGAIRPGDYGTWNMALAISNNIQGFGTISLVRGNLLQTNTRVNAGTYFDWSATAYDQINIQKGFARYLGGTNVFTLVGPTNGLAHGVKFGLGVYDFIIATNITYTPQYDTLVNLLTNTYHLTYGVDFNYGIVNLGGGLFALELAFVPEPSTFLLLALGGLLVWRRIAKRGRKVARS